MRRCPKCGEYKNIESFRTDEEGPGGLKSHCKKCESDYKKSYYKRPEVISRLRGLEYTLRRKYQYIKRRSGGVLAFSNKDFMVWLSDQPRKCHYCGITSEEIDKQNEKKPMRRLTIDRKDNNLGYMLSNMCIACFLCNRLKSNFFSESDFMEIAQKYISSNNGR